MKKQRILILGIDGYIGWPLALHLLSNDYEVCGVDNYSRRSRVEFTKSNSLTPISDISTRELFLYSHKNFFDSSASINISDGYLLFQVLEFYKPSIIVHLAEQPSAPWSMASPRNAAETQSENVLGTLNLLWGMKRYCPEAHLIKLGTMGEYGTPECDIPEGEIPQMCLNGERNFPPECCMSGLPFPRSPGSFYHLSKVHDTHNIIFSCKTWGLRSTDIMQGVVFGLNSVEDESLLTRFDYDEYFGTVINRFCAQALIEHPLTVYGKGEQQRGFLTLSDSIQCITLAIKNPPPLGEYRTFNQFEQVYSINELAMLICSAADKLGLGVGIEHLENPREELEDHYYKPAHEKLLNLGYEPSSETELEILDLMETLLRFKYRIKKEVILPKTTWR